MTFNAIAACAAMDLGYRAGERARHIPLGKLLDSGLGRNPVRPEYLAYWKSGFFQGAMPKTAAKQFDSRTKASK